LGCAAVLVLAALAAYHNTFQVPFLYDDIVSIVRNRTIHDPGNLKDVLTPVAGGFAVSGRPVLNLSLALCYAVSGREVWSYHVFNLLIHILAGLTLLGIVRRTLQNPGIAGQLQQDATPLALAVALLWTLHPLQTESVTYIIQRSESLMGLFFLLTVYGFIRAASSSRPWPWRVLTVLACLGGTGTKEVAVIAPVLVFLYDRTFVAGSFREAWRRRRWLHVSLGATWLPLACLVARTGWDRGGLFGVLESAPPWMYWLTQFKAVVVYLKLAFWPHPLVFEYGMFRMGFREAAPFASIVLLLVAATAVALVRRPAVGFLGAWFFAILAPTSIVLSRIQMIVEHRMYLPLAAVIAATVVALHALLNLRPAPGNIVDSSRRQPWLQRRLPVAISLALAVPLGLATERRNRVYQDEVTLWQEAVARVPTSASAQGGLGYALYMRNRAEEAVHHFQIALELDPTRVDTQFNAGLTYASLGRPADAIRHYEAALRVNPAFHPAHYQWGLALVHLDRPQEALAHFVETIRLVPEMAEAHFGRGVALARMGRLAEAVEHYQAALRLEPGLTEAACQMGAALLRLDRVPDAVNCLRRVIHSDPGLGEAHLQLGMALARLGSVDEATTEFAEAVRLNPAHAGAQFNLGMALVQAGRMADALGPLQKAVELDPTLPEAHCNLGSALANVGRLPEAVEQLQAALRLRFAYSNAHYNLGHVLLRLSRTDEAREHFETALRLDPRFEPARQMLEHLQAAPREP
jgi:protein O-mannosyl-transferase